MIDFVHFFSCSISFCWWSQCHDDLVALFECYSQKHCKDCHVSIWVQLPPVLSFLGLTPIWSSANSRCIVCFEISTLWCNVVNAAMMCHLGYYLIFFVSSNVYHSALPNQFLDFVLSDKFFFVNVIRNQTYLVINNQFSAVVLSHEMQVLCDRILFI